MPSILNLKFKGNKSFVAFSNLGDTESLTKTWKVCTKVASYLEQGSRLENLSWRLWHLQNLMVDTDNARSKREFKKLSKCMGDKLDKEKGRSIEELEAPDFKRNHSTDMLRQKAVEKERNREASQNAKPGTIKRMQFTFSVDQPASTTATHMHVKKPDLKPSAEFNKRRLASRATHVEDMVVADDESNQKDAPLTQRGRKAPTATNESSLSSNATSDSPAVLRFPSLFSNDFGPSALLYPTPTLTTRMNYGEGHNPSSFSDGFSVARPTFELPLDELLSHDDCADSPDVWSSNGGSNFDAVQSDSHSTFSSDQDVLMYPINDNKFSIMEDEEADDSSESDSDDAMPPAHRRVPPVSQMAKESFSQSLAPAKYNGLRGSTPTGRPNLTVRTQGSPMTRSSGPGATATSVNPAVLKSTSGNNSAPGGQKAECSNCGATHTPLWRRGLNDELNCNACGLYCKLHKRPRPKSMRNSHGEGRAQAAPRQESVDVMGTQQYRSLPKRELTPNIQPPPAQCYNCHTTATPLWRKDDEGKTVCNACGLYYKLHGSARPISMKSDVIRKRSRHDARRTSGIEETPSASPGASRRTSPALEASPTLAPDSTTQMSYDYEEFDHRSSQSELTGALGPEGNQSNIFAAFANSFSFSSFPGPYHPDLLQSVPNPPTDALPFASLDSSDMENMGIGRERTSKRRRMSTDSLSEPPSSAVSYSSYNDGYSSQSSSTSLSQRSSMEFPYTAYPAYSILRGSGNTFWHPPMLPQTSSPPSFVHPPMLPNEESHMDYLHPPMLPQDEENLFSTYLHPPMIPSDDSHSHTSLSPPHHKQMYNDCMYSGVGNGRSEFFESSMQNF